MRRTFRFGDSSCEVSVRSAHELYNALEPPTFYIADTNTAVHLPSDVEGARFAPGEGSKSWTEVEALLASMLAADLTRDAVVVGVGGGVVTDVAAFAASLYMRGCRLVLVPTSLLAMVDAALGGKTGVNFSGYKNMVGTFYPAHEVRICTATLSTLGADEYRSGLAEVIKTALLGDRELLELLETRREEILARDPALLEEIVWRCVEVKGGIVEDDLRESGVRAHLNFGHTFAHALESVNGLGRWSHGEAVAWGMARALELGVAAGRTDPAYARRVLSLLDAYEYRLDPLPEAAGSVQDAMRRDKKRGGDRIRFILQRGLTDTFVTEVEHDLVTRVLAGREAIARG